MAPLDDLLTLQSHDSALDRLRFRRASLPEMVELEAKRAARAELEGRRAEVAERRDAELREERRLDDEVRGLEAKAKAVDTKMYSGTVSSPKELTAMQADIDMLRRHAQELEDTELEVLVRREELDVEVAELEAAAAAISAEMETIEASIADQLREIDAEVVVEEAARLALVPSIPEATLRLYEQIRTGNRGVGAARLVGMNCQACHLSLPATEVDRIRHLPEEALARCEHCGAVPRPLTAGVSGAGVIIFARHGQTAPNRDGLVLGRADPDLTEEGQRQAALLGAALATEAVTAILTSPLVRARQTADAVAAACGAPVKVDERLLEIDWGAWEGRPAGSLSTSDLDRLKPDDSATPPADDPVAPEGESLESLLSRRVESFCTETLEAEGLVVAVSHVSPIKAATAWALGVDGAVAWRMFLGLASITRVGKGRTSPVLLSFNETGHLRLGQEERHD